jgi:hypothetical protein
MKKIISALCVTTIFMNFSACGTILHPERSGKSHSNKLDIGIVVLDGIGLLFFIIPGVIAYAVDFSNGTIYLPRSGIFGSIDDLDTKNMMAINVGKENLTADKIKKIVNENSGQNIDIKNAKAFKIDNKGKKIAVNL